MPHIPTDLEPVGKEFQLKGEILRLMQRGQRLQAAVAHITHLDKPHVVRHNTITLNMLHHAAVPPLNPPPYRSEHAAPAAVPPLNPPPYHSEHAAPAAVPLLNLFHF